MDYQIDLTKSAQENFMAAVKSQVPELSDLSTAEILDNITFTLIDNTVANISDRTHGIQYRYIKLTGNFNKGFYGSRTIYFAPYDFRSDLAGSSLVGTAQSPSDGTLDVFIRTSTSAYITTKGLRQLAVHLGLPSDYYDNKYSSSLTKLSNIDYDGDTISYLVNTYFNGHQVSGLGMFLGSPYFNIGNMNMPIVINKLIKENQGLWRLFLDNKYFSGDTPSSSNGGYVGIMIYPAHLRNAMTGNLIF